MSHFTESAEEDTELDLFTDGEDEDTRTDDEVLEELLNIA